MKARLNQELMTVAFLSAKASGKVEEMGHEILDGEEAEVFKIISLVLNPMMTPVILKRRISDGEWVSMENEEDVAMGYREFMSEANDYINSLEEPIQRGEADFLTEEEWTAAIKKEMVDFNEDFSDTQIKWIVERLVEDGFVKEEA